jgi:hypothetical protein
MLIGGEGHSIWVGFSTVQVCKKSAFNEELKMNFILFPYSSVHDDLVFAISTVDDHFWTLDSVNVGPMDGDHAPSRGKALERLDLNNGRIIHVVEQSSSSFSIPSLLLLRLQRQNSRRVINAHTDSIDGLIGECL